MKYTLYFNNTNLGGFDSKKECHSYMWYYRQELKNYADHEIAYNIDEIAYNKKGKLI